MKKISVIVLLVLSLTFAGFAEAAKPKKRTRNANRVGPYGALLVGQARYGAAEAGLEQDLLEFFDDLQSPTRNGVVSSEENDIGYQATFGYRFTRHFAFELALAQYGEMSSTVRGEIDQADGLGFVPANVKYAFSVGGPVFSGIGILPLSEKAEVYARVGYLFASSERELSARVNGASGGSNSAKGDSQNVVYGVGFGWHLNQLYTIRAEYQKISDIGDETRTGTEDLDIVGLGFIIRF